jgi:hypothetical protein
MACSGTALPYLTFLPLRRREEHRLREFENWGVLRGISGPGRDEVTGERRDMSREAVRSCYSLPNTIGMIKSSLGM